MKKIILSLLFIFALQFPVKAEIMAVQAMNNISTTKPNEVVIVKVIRDCRLDNVDLKIGYILEGKMLSVKQPKRLKKDASFTFYPTEYKDLNGQTQRFTKVYVGEFSSKFEVDPVKLAKSAVLTVGNHFVKGISAGYYAVEGAVKNEDNKRVKSAVHNVYENSPLVYVEKGDQLNIKPNTCFGLKFDNCVNAELEEHK